MARSRFSTGSNQIAQGEDDTKNGGRDQYFDKEKGGLFRPTRKFKKFGHVIIQKQNTFDLLL